MTEIITPEEFKKLASKPTKSKYRNKITVVDGIKFQSKKEAKRYSHLKLLLEKGLITDLKRQVRYPIIIDGIKICDYIADFVVTYPSGTVVVEDVKGLVLPIFKLKAKLLKVVNGIDIKLV